MNLRRIVESFRSFPRTEVDAWTLGEMLTALFNDVLSLEFRQDTGELLEPGRVGLYTMYDFPFDVSRACELHVLTVDEKLVGMVTRQGQGDYKGVTLDPEAKASVAGELAVAAIRQDTANLPAVDLDAKIELEPYPMKFLDDAEAMFVLQNPRTVYRLNEIREKHPAYIVGDTGLPLAVTAIGEFKQKGWVDGNAPTDDLVQVSLANGDERLVDATQIVFELVAGQGQLSEVLPAYNRPHSWKVVQETLRGNALGVNRVRIAITVPYRWNPHTVWVDFRSRSALERFVEKYPVGEFVPGIFKSSVLHQYSGKIEEKWEFVF
jgi:hypothetical protein